MNVTAFTYLAFLALVLLFTPFFDSPRSRQVLLLVASYFFYFTWGPWWLVTLFASSLLNFLLGAWLGRKVNASRLWVAIFANISLLLALHYVGPRFAWAPTLSHFLLPVGISFWTFQALSYLLDLYSGEPLDPSLLEFLLYMAFWPTVLSGPVCRLGEMLTEFRKVAPLNYNDISGGTRRILVGLFMKLVLARTLATGLEPGEGVNFGFDGLAGGWSGLDAWALAVAYGMQLYFDFAGYSSIVIGSAQLFGVRVRENFQQPFLSTNLTDFWRRWHMSLSSWIHDYAFLPLASLSPRYSWRLVALVISMGLFGLWHGARLTFLCWGLYQGLLLVGNRLVQLGERTLTRPVPALLAKTVGWMATFACISLGWLLFRAPDLSTAGRMLAAVFTPNHYFHLGLRPNFYLLTLLFIIGYFAHLAGANWLAHLRARTSALPLLPLFQPLYYTAVILAIIVWSTEQSAFVYFQF